MRLTFISASMWAAMRNLYEHRFLFVTLKRLTVLFVTCCWLSGCATKIEHSSDSEELYLASNEVTDALTLAGGTTEIASVHPSLFEATAGPRLHSVRGPLMYLSNKAFTLTLHAEPDAVAKITTVSWQLDYSDLVYRMPADFDPESGIMTLDAELANHGQSGFQTVSYV